MASRRHNRYWLAACVAYFLLYLHYGGCTEPQDLIAPTHLTSVPSVNDLQASVGFTNGGRRRVLLTWWYDTLNTNIRTWDVQRNINDSSVVKLNFYDLVRKPTFGYPFYIDSSSQLQSLEVDSLEIYYRVIPNGVVNNFIGEPSPVLHVLILASQ